MTLRQKTITTHILAVMFFLVLSALCYGLIVTPAFGELRAATRGNAVAEHAVQVGLSITRAVVLAVCAVGVIAAWAAAASLVRSTAARVETLDEFVRDVTQRADVSSRIHLGGDDELAQLAIHLNEMLARLEGAQRQLDSALDAAQQAAGARSQFLARMSHEIRTPMNGVMGMIGLLLETPLTDEQLEYAEAVEDSATSLLTIINDVLDFSKLEAGKLALYESPADLAVLLTRIVRILRPVAHKKGLTLALEVDSALPARVTADSTRLRQVLNNLIGNAIKFTSTGSVRVTADALELGEDSVVVRLEVDDTGVGIATRDVEQLFDAFYQTGDSRRRLSGTGLGLAIAHQLVEQMGGTITVESTVGVGSCFTVDIPFQLALTTSATGTAEVTLGASEGWDEQWRRGARVLVVDDDEVNRRVATHWLRRAGYRVEAAEDGIEAIDMLKRRRFHLVLMDAQMPQLDGLETTAMIRAMPQPIASVPIIAFTASAMRGDREACLEAGMNDFLAKPIDPQHLLATVDLYVAPVDSGDHALPPDAPRRVTPAPDVSRLVVQREIAVDRIGDEALWRDLLGMFVTSARERMDEITTALADQDLARVLLHAHAVKGSAAMVGAEELRAAAELLEKAAPNNASGRAIELRVQLARVQEYFDTLLPMDEASS